MRKDKKRKSFQKHNLPFFFWSNRKEKHLSITVLNVGTKKKIANWVIAEFYTGVEDIDKDIPESVYCPECDGIIYLPEGRE